MALHQKVRRAGRSLSRCACSMGTDQGTDQGTVVGTDGGAGIGQAGGGGLGDRQLGTPITARRCPPQPQAAATFDWDGP